MSSSLFGSCAAPTCGTLRAMRAVQCGFVVAALALSACSDPIPSRSDGGADASVLPDLVVELPFNGPEVTETRTVDAQPGILDVHFSIDTSASFSDEIATLERDLSTRLIPNLRARVNDTAFGVSSFEDFPVSPFGTDDDLPFELAAAITTEASVAQAAVAGLELGSGGDSAESGYEALYQIATGEGIGAFVEPFTGEGEGGVGFREGALRVVVHISDAPAHTPEEYGAAVPGAHGEDDVVSAMQNINALVVGIASGAEARPQLEQLALDTGAVVDPDSDGNCPTGLGGAAVPPVSGVCPQVFDISGGGDGLSDAVEDGIVGLLDTVRFNEVFGETIDDPEGFVQGFVARGFSAPDVEPPRIVDLRPPGDGVDDTFQDVSRGTELRMGILLRNTSVRPTSVTQEFLVRVNIVGDEAVIEALDILVIVPPEGGSPGSVSGGGILSDGSCSASSGRSGGFLVLLILAFVGWRRR
ncbi:MAG: vWA domain-containing protein [Myxococcota bacterium]